MNISPTTANSQPITASKGYGNVSNLRSLHNERVTRNQEQQERSDALAVIDRVEHKIEDVASLGQSKHNRSLKPEQVVLDQYRSGLKVAFMTVGNALVNLSTLFVRGAEIPKGLDAVLNRGADGKVESFEAVEKSHNWNFNYEEHYSKQLQEDGSTMYRVTETDRAKASPSLIGTRYRSSTVRMESNGTLFIKDIYGGSKQRKCDGGWGG